MATKQFEEYLGGVYAEYHESSFVSEKTSSVMFYSTIHTGYHETTTISEIHTGYPETTTFSENNYCT